MFFRKQLTLDMKTLIYDNSSGKIHFFDQPLMRNAVIIEKITNFESRGDIFWITTKRDQWLCGRIQILHKISCITEVVIERICGRSLRAVDPHAALFIQIYDRVGCF